jgi:transcriptional regulator with XRE-family HTH domain
MSTLGEQLRLAREAQGRSLDDIAQATRISKKFLEDIELNRPLTLPATYVHAFIKSFAAEVGLDPASLLQPTPSAGAPEEPTRDGAEPIPSGQPTGEEIVDQPSAKRQTRVIVALFFLIAAGLVVSMLWLRNERRAERGQEASFSDVVKEQEAKRVAPASDSLPPSHERPQLAAAPDSLFLEGVASESVWVRVVIDGARTAEYTLPPSFHMQWKARKNFLVSVGNASVVTFTLNGKHLGALATERKPVRNVPLSHESLQSTPSVGAKKGRDGAR